MAHPIAIAIAAAGAYMGLKLVKRVAKIAKNTMADGADGADEADHKKKQYRDELPTLRQDPETGIYEIDKPQK